MSAVDYVEHQRAVRWMEYETARRRGVAVKTARRMVAREIGVAPGTIEDIRKGRLKGLRGSVERLIDAAFVKMLRSTIEGLTHDLAIASARGVDRSLVAKAEASRLTLEQLVEEAKRRGGR